MAQPRRHRLGGELVTLREIARRAGVSHECVRQRLRRGELPEEIVASGGWYRQRYRLHGRPISASEIGRRIGMTPEGVMRRLSKGESPEEIVRRGRLK